MSIYIKMKSLIFGKTFFISLAFGILFFVMSGAFAQKVKITLGPSQIGSNEIYTITLTAQNEDLREYSNFPAIPGFSKAGTSSSSSMQSINGQVSNETSIIQNYMPEKEGVFKLPPFSMKVNGEMVKSPGATIKVGPPAQQRATDPFGGNPFAYDPFEDFFGKGRAAELKDVKAEAIFSIQTDKTEIWAGEGVNMTMSFLVSDENQAELDFYNLGAQLSELVKKAKPANCWEENFGIEEIIPRKVKIGKKNYTEYRIYQATLFPLVAKSFTIPQLKLDVVTYKMGSANFFGANRKEEVKPFYSRPVNIKVKELPPHPMKGNVSVGQFAFEEKLGKKIVGLNQGIGFDLAIKGEGNISYIPEPQKTKSDLLDVYAPNTNQTIQRAGGRVTGSKMFSYLLIPKEIGYINLKKAFYWVYFNTKTASYDTLRPESGLRVVEGKSLNSKNAATSEDAFYSLIDGADNTLLSETKKDEKWLFWINISIGLMAAVTLVISFMKR
jgi:hypothetical protein